MADEVQEPQANATAAAAATPARKSRGWLGAVAAMVLALGSAVTVGLIAFPDETPSEEATAPQKVQTTVPVPQLLVNMADGKGMRLLQVTAALELEGPGESAMNAGFERLLPRIQDRMILILSALTSAETAGGANKEFIKTRIKDELNRQVLAEAVFKVSDVFFTEFVIQ